MHLLHFKVELQPNQQLQRQGQVHLRRPQRQLVKRPKRINLLLKKPKTTTSTTPATRALTARKKATSAIKITMIIMNILMIQAPIQMLGKTRRMTMMPLWWSRTTASRN
jgi:hypothetical protein